MELKQDSYDFVLIIGNGFDLNLGLKTCYSNFVESDFFRKLVLYDNQLCKHLYQTKTLQKWIDIENELKDYSNKFKPDSNIFLKEFKDLSEGLKKYLRTINYEKIDKTSFSYKLIESIKDDDVLIIDFNYTFSLNMICKELGIGLNGESSNFEHIKIHGSIDEKDEIIFGVEDKAKVSPNHVFLKKSVTKNFNAIDFSKEILASESFVIFGHSLGETDHMYFEHFFRNLSIQPSFGEKQNVYIYYHGEQSYLDIFSQIDKLTMNKISKFKQSKSFKAIDTKNNG